jgi:3-oxoadipate enol-lactonase/4-carboxymuconolactone decarboxylase
MNEPRRSRSGTRQSDVRAAYQAFRTDARPGTLDTGRYRMRYFVWGSGPPLVFIHGMADGARAFVMVMHRLIGERTCIAYELPDGTTDGSSLARYSLADYTADLLALLDHLHLPRAAVLGSSFGSLITLNSLAAAPGRFDHGILQGGFAHRPLDIFQRHLAEIARFWPGWFADWPGIHEAVMKRMSIPTFLLMSRATASYFLKIGARTPIRAAATRSIIIDRTDLRPLLPKITTPLLLIGGDRDPLVPRACELEIERSVPGARRIEFRRCGHYPQYTHPVLMAGAIQKFLNTAR